MERISVTQAVRRFSDLLNRVLYHGASFELGRGNQVVARLSPAKATSPVKVMDLNRLFAELPPLGDEADRFAQDLQEAGKPSGRPGTAAP